MAIQSWGDAVVVFTLAYGSVIRNTVDVECTVLAFIIGKTLHYCLTNPSFRFFSSNQSIFNSLLLSIPGESHYFSKPTSNESSSSKRGRRPTQHVHDT